jgi:ribosomal protein L12E/L44/L45/RPP1/RPP2
MEEREDRAGAGVDERAERAEQFMADIWGEDWKELIGESLAEEARTSAAEGSGAGLEVEGPGGSAVRLCEEFLEIAREHLAEPGGTSPLPEVPPGKDLDEVLERLERGGVAPSGEV